MENTAFHYVAGIKHKFYCYILYGQYPLQVHSHDFLRGGGLINSKCHIVLQPGVKIWTLIIVIVQLKSQF